MSWLLHATRWVRNPPSMGRVKFMLAIAAIAYALFLYEQAFGWPEILTVDPMRSR
jgi:hypothetical protein